MGKGEILLLMLILLVGSNCLWATFTVSNAFGVPVAISTIALAIFLVNVIQKNWDD